MRHLTFALDLGERLHRVLSPQLQRHHSLMVTETSAVTTGTGKPVSYTSHTGLGVTVTLMNSHIHKPNR